MPNQKPPAKNVIKDEFIKIWGLHDEDLRWAGFKIKVESEFVVIN